MIKNIRGNLGLQIQVNEHAMTLVGAHSGALQGEALLIAVEGHALEIGNGGLDVFSVQGLQQFALLHPAAGQQSHSEFLRRVTQVVTECFAKFVIVHLLQNLAMEPIEGQWCSRTYFPKGVFFYA